MYQLYIGTDLGLLENGFKPQGVWFLIWFQIQFQVGTDFG